MSVTVGIRLQHLQWPSVWKVKSIYYWFSFFFSFRLETVRSGVQNYNFMCLQICVSYVRNLKWLENYQYWFLQLPQSFHLPSCFIKKKSHCHKPRLNMCKHVKVPESPESTHSVGIIFTWKSAQPSQILRRVFSDMLCDYRSPAEWWMKDEWIRMMTLFYLKSSKMHNQCISAL